HVVGYDLLGVRRILRRGENGEAKVWIPITLAPTSHWSNLSDSIIVTAIRTRRRASPKRCSLKAVSTNSVSATGALPGGIICPRPTPTTEKGRQVSVCSDLHPEVRV